MDIKEVTLSLGPTLKIGGFFCRSQASITLNKPTPEDLKEAKEFLKKQYLLLLVKEVSMGQTLDNVSEEFATEWVKQRFAKK